MKKSLYISNKAVLKSAAWWIVAAYIWKLLYFPFSWIVSPEVMPIEQLRPAFFHVLNDCKYVPLFGDIVFLTLAIIAFIKLHAHTNQILRRASRWFILAYIIEVVWEQTNAGMVIANYLYGATDSLWQFFLVFFIISLLAYSPLIMTFAYLGKSSVIAYYHLPIVCLSILTIISSADMIVNYQEQLVNQYLGVYNCDFSHIILFSTVYSGGYVAYIICWWKLFHIPADIPATEDISEAAPVSPLEMGIFHIMALFVFTVLIFVMVSLVRSMLPNL